MRRSFCLFWKITKGCLLWKRYWMDGITVFKLSKKAF